MAGTIPAAGANLVTVTARDYVFDAPEQLPSGLTTFQLINEGPELHHVWLVRLEEEKTMDDLFRFMQAGGHELPAWAVSVGGPNSPVPGGESNATLFLEPGNYAMLCVIPSPDGTPHIMKGMARPLVVTPGATSAAAAEPAADVVMSLTDYDFTLSEPITAGRRTIRVENAGPQDHEVFFMMLAPGKSLADLMQWLQTEEGPPPGKPLGGTAPFGTGLANTVTIDFEPGDYALICFIPDTGDGRPHLAHGMIKQITVN